MAVTKKAYRAYVATCAKCPEWSDFSSRRYHADNASKQHQITVHGRLPRKRRSRYA
jgi:hypothetical protein